MYIFVNKNNIALVFIFLVSLFFILAFKKIDFLLFVDISRNSAFLILSFFVLVSIIMLSNNNNIIFFSLFIFLSFFVILANGNLEINKTIKEIEKESNLIIVDSKDIDSFRELKDKRSTYFLMEDTSNNTLYNVRVEKENGKYYFYFKLKEGKFIKIN